MIRRASVASPAQIDVVREKRLERRVAELERYVQSLEEQVDLLVAEAVDRGR